MGGSPTGNSIPQEVIHDFKGLNDQQDSVNRPPGSVTDMRNMYDETSHDADRRPGRDFVSLDDGNAVGVIYQLSWADGGVNVINQSGDKIFTDPFDFPNRGEIPDLSPPGQPPGPPGPFGPPIKFAKKPSGIPDLVPLIRAMSESLLFSNNDVESALNPPAQRWSFNFFRKNRDGSKTLVTTNVRTKKDYLDAQRHDLFPQRIFSPIAAPVPYIDLPLDHYWADYVADPALAVSDLQNFINTYNSVIVVKFLKTYPDPHFYGKTTMPNYTGADIFVQPAFNSTFKEVWAAFSTTVNTHLTNIKKTTTQQQVMQRSGTASDGFDCNDAAFVDDPPLLCQYNNIGIVGYNNAFFDTSGNICCDTPSVGGSFNGSFGPGIGDGDICVFGCCGWGSFIGQGGKAINTVEFFCAQVCYTGGTSFSVRFECNGGGCPSPDDHIIWAGTKDDATTSPYGIYTRIPGTPGGISPTPSTLTLTGVIDMNFC